MSHFLRKNYSPHNSIEHSNSIISATSGNNSISRVKKFFETKKNKKTINEFDNSGLRPQSPTSMSLNFLKRQDPFYKKFNSLDENELLEVIFPPIMGLLDKSIII